MSACLLIFCCSETTQIANEPTEEEGQTKPWASTKDHKYTLQEKWQQAVVGDATLTHDGGNKITGLIADFKCVWWLWFETVTKNEFFYSIAILPCNVIEKHFLTLIYDYCVIIRR